MEASYSGTSSYADSSAMAVSLTVTPASTATSVSVTPGSQPFAATGAGTFDLTADVTSIDSIGEGTVTFTIKDGSNHVIDTVSNVTVSGGQAECANYSLPANTPAGSYTVEASYSGTSNYAASSSATSASLNVGPADTSTSANVTPDSQFFASTGAGTFDLTAGVITPADRHGQ